MQWDSRLLAETDQSLGSCCCECVSYLYPAIVTVTKNAPKNIRTLKTIRISTDNSNGKRIELRKQQHFILNATQTTKNLTVKETRLEKPTGQRGAYTQSSCRTNYSGSACAWTSTSSRRHAGHGSLGQSRRTDKRPSSGVVVALLHDCRSSLRTARLPAKAYDHAVAPLARF